MELETPRVRENFRILGHVPCFLITYCIFLGIKHALLFEPWKKLMALQLQHA